MAEVAAVEQLCSMFSTLPPSCVADVLAECGNDSNKALEKLLQLGETSPQTVNLGVNNDEVLAYLLPPEHSVRAVSPDSGPSSTGWAEQDTATPWMDPSFGSFAGSTSSPPAPAITNQSEERNGWPPWGAAGTASPQAQPPLHCTAALEVQGTNQRCYTSPELPSNVGWADSPEDIMLAGPEFDSGNSSLSSSQPTTPLPPNGFQGMPESSLPDLSDNELSEALPHLAQMFHTPSPSGTSSPLNSSSPPATRGPTAMAFPDLNSANVLNPDMALELFPNLTAAIVHDVLDRCNGQAALKHLMMLSQCAAEACDGKEVPDEAAWGSDSGSSCGDETSHECDASDHLTPLEKLHVLQEQFSTINPTEVAAVLEASDGKLEQAASVLRTFAAEDAAAVAPASAVLEKVDSVATIQLADSVAAIQLADSVSEGSAQAAAKVEQLRKCFPSAEVEFLQIALQLNSFDIAGAHKLLLEQGYIEVVNQQPQLKALPLPEALPPAASSSPPLALSLSERTYYRNQQIYDEEREQQRRLVQARNKLRQMGNEHRMRGEYDLARSFFEQADRYQEQIDRESKQASRRIGRRVNSGQMGVLQEDFHGQHVDEMLEKVEEQVRSLPKLFSSGVQVKYITGKGNHSANGTKLKPALIELLTHHGIPFSEFPGGVVATFNAV